MSDRDGVHPGRERAPPVELREVRDHLAQDVLRRVLRVVDVSEHPQTEPEDRRLEFHFGPASDAGKIDADLQRRGTTVDSNDVMIAAIALGASIPLVTGNTAHFETVKSGGYPLVIENWRAQI